MEKITVRLKKLNENAHIPTYGTEGAAGADLYACIDSPVTIQPGETVMVGSGIAAELPAGFVGLVFARSGLAAKRSLAPANKVGVIDCDYRGEIIVSLHNHGCAPSVLEPGERLAQLVIVPYLSADFELCDSLSDTVRGVGGYGSTGTK